MPHPLDDLRALTPHTIQTVCEKSGITKECWYKLKQATKRGPQATTVFGLAAALETTPEAIMERLCPPAQSAL